MKLTCDSSGTLGRDGIEAVANGSRSAIAAAAGASTLPSAGFSSATGGHYRVPTPTEQTPSPRKGMPNGVGGGVFAFGVDSPDSSGPDKRDDHGYFEASGGGSKRAGGCGGNLGTGYEQGQGVSPARRWRSEDVGGGESDDEVEGGGVDAGFREEMDVFASSLRRDFERKLMVTARDGLAAACERERSAGRLRLEAQRRHSSEEILHLEGEGRRLEAEVARLRSANTALEGKAEVFAERLSALHARTHGGSHLARCLCAWRGEAVRMRAERSKNVTAGDHARRKLMSRTLGAWRGETRQRINSRGRKEADLKLHAISKEIIGRYETELSSTRAALDDAISQIALEKARQREMEEGMRRTLLRGMSAMNMEAMRLMTEASRDAGEDEFGLSGTTGTTGTRYSAGGTDAPSFGARAAAGAAHHSRLSEEWPRPLTPPRPAVPSSR
ncbi:unnamed protein product [Ectocarpus sp. 4 AP-2014]